MGLDNHTPFDRMADMKSPTREEILGFLTNTNTTYLLATVEAARIALADGEIADEISTSINISDSDINELQHRLHLLTKGIN
jgi:hypothetical protein